MPKVYTIDSYTVTYGGYALRELGNGSLNISKTVNGSGFDPTKTFEIVVTFSVPVTYNGTTSTTHTFNLAHGQSVTITGIPELTTYEVTETPLSQQDINAGYSIEGIVGGSGSIDNDATQLSEASNSYSTPTFGRLSITKRISGSHFNTAQPFEVVVTFGSAILYSVDGVMIDSPSATFTSNLIHGQTVVLGDIPSGTTYSIVETALTPEIVAEGYSAGTITNSSGTLYSNSLVESVVSNRYRNSTGHQLIFEFDDINYDPTTARQVGSSTLFHPYAATGSVDPEPWCTWTRLSSEPNVWGFDASRQSWQYYGGNIFRDIVNYSLFSDIYGCPNVKLIHANTGNVPSGPYTSDRNLGVLFQNANKLTDIVWYYIPEGGINLGLSFAKCNLLKAVPIFDTRGYRSMSFGQCYALESVPLFDTSSMSNLRSCFRECHHLRVIPNFDTRNVTSFDSFAEYCYGLTEIPLLDTTSATDVDYMFKDCLNIEQGSLALYTQMANQSTPPASHRSTFLRCGRDTVTGAAELAQIPTTWGGTAT